MSGRRWYSESMVATAKAAISERVGGSLLDDELEFYALAVLDAIRDPRHEVGQHFEEALREDRDKWSFNALVAVARLMLDRLYPEDTMRPMGRDAGPRFTLALRAALDELEDA
jgi:hypothetical protein